jgi:predicted RNase H-like nuclease (RuvC/YqgF family)
MDLLVKLKESLTELSKGEPNRLQTGVIACASKCDEVLRRLKTEKRDTERELDSGKASIEKLTSELTLCKETIHGTCMYVIDMILHDTIILH